jgi:hypothetical protein
MTWKTDLKWAVYAGTIVLGLQILMLALAFFCEAIGVMNATRVVTRIMESLYSPVISALDEVSGGARGNIIMGFLYIAAGMAIYSIVSGLFAWLISLMIQIRHSSK